MIVTCHTSHTGRDRGTHANSYITSVYSYPDIHVIHDDGINDVSMFSTVRNSLAHSVSRSNGNLLINSAEPRY